jgi:ASC-1-like (ASCH) protein
MKNIYIRNKLTFININNGRKTTEGRLNYGMFKNIKKGDMINFVHNNNKIKVKIINVCKFLTFEKMLINMKNVLPSVLTLSEGVKYYNTMYSKIKQDKYEVLAINFFKI